MNNRNSIFILVLLVLAFCGVSAPLSLAASCPYEEPAKKLDKQASEIYQQLDKDPEDRRTCELVVQLIAIDEARDKLHALAKKHSECKVGAAAHADIVQGLKESRDVLKQCERRGLLAKSNDTNADVAKCGSGSEKVPTDCLDESGQKSCTCLILKNSCSYDVVTHVAISNLSYLTPVHVRAKSTARACTTTRGSTIRFEGRTKRESGK